MAKRFLKFFLAFTFTAPLHAQDGCVALLRHGIYNTYRSTSGNSSASSARSDFCTAYSQSKQTGHSAGLEASYKVFSGKATYSDQSAEALASSTCSNSFTASQADAMLDTFSQVIDSNAVDAYKTCTAAARGGLMYTITPSETSANTISVEMHYQPGVGITSGQQRVDRVTVSQDANIAAIQGVTCKGKLWDQINPAPNRPPHAVNAHYRAGLYDVHAERC